MTATRIAKDLAASVLLPPLSLLAVAAAVLPGAFTGGGTRRWGRGRVEDLRAEAQEAKDAAATAFYELDTAQRDLRITIETITAADDSPRAARAAADFAAFGERVDRVSQDYITAMDAHDLDSGSLDAGTASRARQGLLRAKDELVRVREELERFGESLRPLVERAESQLAQVAPAVERARRALRAATEALDTARGAGLRAEDQAAALAALGPELRKLNEGAGQHGIKPTIRRAEDVRRRAEAIAAEAERLPRRAKEIDRRLSSLRTRAEAITTRAGQVEPVLSELRRRFSVACWQDLQKVPEQAEESVRQAEETLREARRAHEEQRFADATARLTSVHELLGRTDEAVSAAGERLRRLNEVSFSPRKEIERTRFVIRDAQRLAMNGRTFPEPRHAGPLDAAVERLERAIGDLENGGRNPDYWRFLTETEAVRGMVAAVVEDIRSGR
ncbi:hypothetical protein [Streptomyces litchfieldiae]|uniref:Chromosome partition protein Smc n=1 Tax=Streptomyces litchfieldiae TaxID=3075543 RepID=A0ABU2MXE5_9ACTN|nr:hypothetical protein [Streptomyces sp. DSM 44938]MDT0346294.1 hypothetical protein [Streptomyces sp. DSM 44938]